MEVLKICGVCGDKALGYNFNALTCESCKAFFRRNALRNKTFRCITAGNCVLNAKTRKYCRKCRLDKCFQIGMKKDWILTEEEKVLKRRKHRNRDTEKKDADSSSMDCLSDVTPTLVDKNKNNIFILPILPISMKGDSASSDVFQSLNKSDLINFINKKLNMTLDSATSSVNIGGNGRNASGDAIMCSVNNFQASNNNEGGNSSILVYPDNANNGNEVDAMRNTVECSESYSRDISSDNSSCSFSSFFSVNGGAGSVETTAASPDQTNSELQSSKNVPNLDKSGIEINCAQSGQNNNPVPGQHLEWNCSSNGTESDWKISDMVYKHAIQLEYSPNPLKTVSSFGEEDDKCCAKLNKLEESRLEEVNRNFRPLYVTGTKEYKMTTMEVEDGLRYFEIVIRKIIIAVKNIESFKNMCQNDQIALLKGSAGEIRSILNLRYFNEREGICSMPHPYEPDSMLVMENAYFRQTYGDELYNQCTRFILSFRPDWKNDESITNLMAMILLFYPDRPNLQHKEYIMLEYLTYSHLLQRYLQVKYNSVCEAKTIYINLISRLEELHTLNERGMELILKMDPKYIGPLTIELYDLQNKLMK